MGAKSACVTRATMISKVLFFVLASGFASDALFVSDLYPFGAQNGDTQLPTQDQEDISSMEIKLNTAVKFFDREYKSIFVSFPVGHLDFRSLWTQKFGVL